MTDATMVQALYDRRITQWFTVASHKLLTKTCVSRWVKRVGTIVLVSRKLCIKSTAFTSLAEADTMRFIANNTTIPVPKVYCAFERKGRVYILMERVEGQDLSNGWLRRTQQSRDKILQDLKLLIQQLHDIPAPKNVGVSNVRGGPINDPRLPDRYYGPFSSIREFHSALCDGVIDNLEGGEMRPELMELAAFYNQAYPISAFTHGDLSSMNIMVQGERVVAIVDWETAGWMPPYWEYTSAYHVNPQNQFWQQEIAKFISPNPEALRAEMIRRRVFE